MPTPVNTLVENPLTPALLALRVELQCELGTTDTYTEEELLNYHKLLWIKDNLHSGAMMPSSFPVSEYFDGESGIRKNRVKQLAEIIQSQNEFKKRNIAPIVRGILDEGNNNRKFI